ncbi:serine/threonine protein kinase [Candidatus Thiomargarita nelsonii]|uniref:Serine/threonine protein kinase n=1 Tax=Candidatus Thiomargarita nelsonii TaxID=1003181 RepID=A0A0A6PMU7_9GAMM|nr:serine/threonine protein kinase [Candidatus Thiomargarita nelsonii]
MNQLLTPKQTVQLDNGLSCQVEQFIGDGAQGEVYQANVNGKPIALKWYYSKQVTPEHRSSIEKLIKIGPPNDKFLWPLALATLKNVKGFGYIMPLRESHYKGIKDLMKRRIEPSFRALLTAGLELAHSFLQLHAKGLCYRDISFGNVFFEPNTGKILICDNDNVTIDGERKKSGILGTPRFMAPEIVSGAATPNTQSDLFSLAVLLFYMMIIHHPLEGKKESQIKCFDLPAMNKLYGSEPVFIFDPHNHSNHPVQGYHDNAMIHWPIFPQSFRDLFTKAFTSGIRDPNNGRVRESEWRSMMVGLRDSIIYCEHCGLENFYDLDLLKMAGKLNPCWHCQKQLKTPPRIRIDRQIVMLNHDTQLFPHHIEKNYDFSQAIAAVNQHPKNSNIWGLKNISPKSWVVNSPNGSIKNVPSGQSVTILAGTKINFGKTQGEIRL